MFFGKGDLVMSIKSSTKSEVVYYDLSKLYTELNHIRREKKAFRLAFELYLFKSQQLTETMRSEFHEMTGLKWEASKFKGWNIYTAALKKIRNAAVHGSPIILYDFILSVYLNISFSLDEFNKAYSQNNKRRFRLTKTRAFISDPFVKDFQYTGIAFLESNKDKNYAYPIKEFISYELRLDMMGIKKLNGFKILRVDVIKLLLHSYPVFKKYRTFYKQELNDNLLDSYQPDFLIKNANGSRKLNPKY